MSNLKETVKENYNICDYVNNHIIPNRAYRGSNRPLKKKSPILCPFHKETQPSFYYHADKNRFNCFGCGISGDVIDLHRFWMQRLGRNVGFYEAVTELYTELKTKNQ